MKAIGWLLLLLLFLSSCLTSGESASGWQINTKTSVGEDLVAYQAHHVSRDDFVSASFFELSSPHFLSLAFRFSTKDCPHLMQKLKSWPPSRRLLNVSRSRPVCLLSDYEQLGIITG